MRKTREYKEWHRRQTCGAKKCYGSRRTAKAKLKELHVTKEMEAYECPYCGFWHIGHPSKGLDMAEGQYLRRQIIYPAWAKEFIEERIEDFNIGSVSMSGWKWVPVDGIPEGDEVKVHFLEVHAHAPGEGKIDLNESLDILTERAIDDTDET